MARTINNKSESGKADLASSHWVRTLQAFKDTIDTSDLLLKKESNYIDYPALELFFLETVLDLLGMVSHRKKSGFLLNLKTRGDLTGFYRLLGLKGAWFLAGHAPGMATWTQYKVRLNPAPVFQPKSPPDAVSGLAGVDVIAFDGKEIRLSAGRRKRRAKITPPDEPEPVGQPGHRNTQLINVVSHHTCVLSVPVVNENRWIRDSFVATARELAKQQPGRPVTGDKAYCKGSVLRAFLKDRIPFVLPLNLNIGQRLRTSVFGQLARKRNSPSSFRHSHVDKNGGVVTESLVITVRNTHCDSDRLAPWLTEITCTRHHPNRPAVRSTVVLLSNVEPGHDQNPAEMFFQYRRRHWQVETYHHRLDVWHHQDRYAKNPLGAAVAAFRHACLDSVCRRLALHQKPAFELFRSELLMDLREAIFCALILGTRPKAFWLFPG